MLRRRKVIGVNECEEEFRYAYLRFSSWKNEIENGYFFAQHYSQAQMLAQTFFPGRFDSIGLLRKSLHVSLPADRSKATLSRDLAASPLEELGLLILSPTLVANGEHVYPTDAIIKERCNISAIRKGVITEEELAAIFAPPSPHSLSALVTDCMYDTLIERRICKGRFADDGDIRGRHAGRTGDRDREVRHKVGRRLRAGQKWRQTQQPRFRVRMLHLPDQVREDCKSCDFDFM